MKVLLKKLIILPLLFFSAGSLIFAQQKYALVIGNSNYTGISRLNNPVNDANDMEGALRDLGFTVEKVLNGTLEQMETAVLNLQRRLGGSRNTYGFFFYAGHGVQSNGENYLIPVIADNIRSEAQLRNRAVSLQFVLDSLSEAGNELNMVVLDACRDNPFGWARSGSRGLSVVSHAPAGTVVMYAAGAGQTASDGNETQHQVTVSSFYMGRYEVTQREYQDVMGYNPSYFTGDLNRPVEQVTWFDAIEYCNRLSQREGLTPVYTITGRTPASGYPITAATVTSNWNANGYRLPTEAEWEYACRAGTTTAYNTGANISDNTGWYFANSNFRTQPVGQKPANAWGLHDMHGNVWEWCWDWHGTYASAAQTNPRGASSGSFRVLRGGGWFSGALSLRSASRYSIDPYGWSSDGGFRVVRNGG